MMNFENKIKEVNFTIGNETVNAWVYEDDPYLDVPVAAAANLKENDGKQTIIVNESFFMLKDEEQKAMVAHELGHIKTMTIIQQMPHTDDPEILAESQVKYLEGMKSGDPSNFYHALECVADRYAHFLGYGKALASGIRELCRMTSHDVSTSKHMLDRLHRLETGDYDAVVITHSVTWMGNTYDASFDMSCFEE